MNSFLPLMTDHLRHQTRGRLAMMGGGRGRKRREQSRKSVKAKWKQTCQAQDEVTGERPQGK